MHWSLFKWQESFWDLWFKAEDLRPSVQASSRSAALLRSLLVWKLGAEIRSSWVSFHVFMLPLCLPPPPFLPFKPIFAVSSLNKLRLFSLRTLKVPPRRMWKSLKLDPESVQTKIWPSRRRFWSSVTRHGTFLCLSHLWRHDGGQRLFEVFWTVV